MIFWARATFSGPNWKALDPALQLHEERRGPRPTSCSTRSGRSARRPAPPPAAATRVAASTARRSGTSGVASSVLLVSVQGAGHRSPRDEGPLVGCTPRPPTVPGFDAKRAPTGGTDARRARSLLGLARMPPTNVPYGIGEERLAHLTCPRAPGSHRGRRRPRRSRPGRRAQRSAAFVDMVTGEPALYDTRVACLWDERCFYVAYWIAEPQVRATLTERDSFIWKDNDVELFVAGDDCYYELEINALGTVYEAFFVWQDALRSGRPLRPTRARPARAEGGHAGRLPGPEPVREAPARPALRLPRLRPRRPAHRGPGGRPDQRPHDRRPGLDGGDGAALGEPRPACSTAARSLPARERPCAATSRASRPCASTASPCPRTRARASTPTASTTRTSRRASASCTSRRRRRWGTRRDPGWYPREHGVARGLGTASTRFADYLSLEEASNTKHEFLNGEIYAMAGGTPAHAALAVAAGGRAGGSASWAVLAVSSARILRVRVEATGLTTYPDVTVVCGPWNAIPRDADTVTNPGSWSRS